MNVVLLERTEIERDVAVIDGPRAAHVLTVLRAAVGSSIQVGVVDGPLGTAEIIGIETLDVDAASGDGAFRSSPAHGAQCVRLRVTLERATPPVPRIDLILALPRPKVLARLYSPLAQLGVRRLMLTGAYKVEKAYFDTHVLTPETWRPLLLEGLAQVRDTRVPLVTVHRSPTWLVREELDALVPEPAVRLVADPSAHQTPRTALGRGHGPEGRVVLAIGPEGGWAPREARLLDAHGFTRVGVGPRALRSDVAVVALLSVVHDALAG